MTQKFMFNNNYCNAIFKPNNMLADGTITDITIYHSCNRITTDVEATFNPEKNCLQLITSVFIPENKKDNADDNKCKKLVYIHLTKDNTNFLKTFLKDKEEFYSR